MNVEQLKQKYLADDKKSNYGQQQNVNVSVVRANAKQAVAFAEKILKRCNENLEKANKMKASDPVVNTQRSEDNLKIIAMADQKFKSLLLLK